MALSSSSLIGRIIGTWLRKNTTDACNRRLRQYKVKFQHYQLGPLSFEKSSAKNSNSWASIDSCRCLTLDYLSQRLPPSPHRSPFQLSSQWSRLMAYLLQIHLPQYWVGWGAYAWHISFLSLRSHKPVPSSLLWITIRYGDQLRAAVDVGYSPQN